MDYKGLAAALLSRAPELLPSWLPNGRQRGREFVCGDIFGNPGDSLSVNCQTGVWADFANEEDRGSDLISLYAAIHSIAQGRAASELAERYGLGQPAAPPRKPVESFRPIKPNGQASAFTGEHARLGTPSALYCYRDAAGDPSWYVCRYETPAGKVFSPWTYTEHGWTAQAPPAPRSLYGLEKLSQHAQAPALIVEGEKCVDAASALTGWITLTWPNGAQAVGSADWQPLAGRDVTIWPDADSPGIAAAQKLSGILKALGCTVNVLDVSGEPAGFDLFDAVQDGLSLEAFISEHSFHPPARPSQPTASVAPRSAGTDADLASEEDDGSGSHSFRFENEAWEHYGLLRGSGGKPAANMDSAYRVARQHPDTRDRLWFDAFRDRMMLADEPWTDVDTLRWTLLLQREVHLPKMSTTSAYEGALLYAHERARHPIREWLDSLPPRTTTGLLERLFVDGFGASDTAYVRAAGVSLLIAAIARAFDPGCMVKTMPVLEGAQDIGKSSAIAILGGEWYLDCSERLDSKDFYQALQGHWFVELAELASMMRTSPEATKACVSRKNDHYRASYGRTATDHQRHCVFVASTNTVDWQLDDTGGVRFLPIACTRIDLGWIRQHRDALFAEALARYRAGESWWSIPKDAAAMEQELRHIDDPWTEAIREHLASRTQTTVRDCLMAIGVESKHMRNADSYRVARILKRFGWTVRVERRAYGTDRVYRPATRSD